MSKNSKAKDKKMNTTNTIIIEYQVAIYIADVDKNGNKTDQYFEKNFKSTDMLTNRRKAIDYYRLQINFFLNESQIDFSSPEEARIKNYKDYKSFSISLQVSDNNENCFYIDEYEPESIFEFLNYESNILKTDQNTDFILVDDCWGGTQKVIKEDYGFFNLNTF
jgi:hypothetical protein